MSIKHGLEFANCSLHKFRVGLVSQCCVRKRKMGILLLINVISKPYGPRFLNRLDIIHSHKVLSVSKGIIQNTSFRRGSVEK